MCCSSQASFEKQIDPGFISAYDGLMSSSIVQVLPDDLINHIAAGEVVERPAAVVKELVENAIDAGATHIDIEIEDGGLSAIRVSDNGSGMNEVDAQTALLRHATSKVRRLEDLSSLSTLGFRGEALSSIAAVSKLRLLTRQANAQAGFALEVEGGRIVSQGVAGSPVGTSISANELFFNTPARRKFMRSPATEQAHVVDWLHRVMLGAPHVSAVLTQRGRRLVDISASSVDMRLQNAFGARLGPVTASAVKDEASAVAVKAFCLAPDPRRVSQLGLWFFVNGRFVRDRMLQRAVAEGFGAGAGQPSPQGFFFIELLTEGIDINVHPQKLEVRFENPEPIYRCLTQAATQARSQWSAPEALASTSDKDPVGTASFANRSVPWRPKGLSKTSHVRPYFKNTDIDEASSATDSGVLTSVASPGSDAPAFDESLWARLDILGHAPQGYLACCRGDQLCLVSARLSQVAAVTSQLAQAVRVERVVSREAMLPTLWTAPSHLQEAAEDFLVDMADGTTWPWGLRLEAVGPGRFLITASVATLDTIPAEKQCEALLQSLVPCAKTPRQAFIEDKEAVVKRWAVALSDTDTPWLAFGGGLPAMRSWLVFLQKAAVPMAAPYIKVLCKNLKWQ